MSVKAYLLHVVTNKKSQQYECIVWQRLQHFLCGCTHSSRVLRAAPKLGNVFRAGRRSKVEPRVGRSDFLLELCFCSSVLSVLRASAIRVLCLKHAGLSSQILRWRQCAHRSRPPTPARLARSPASQLRMRQWNARALLRFYVSLVEGTKTFHRGRCLCAEVCTQRYQIGLHFSKWRFLTILAFMAV